MRNAISRRDWLKLIGGSALGMILTPFPWKILDESAKWTQSWSQIPMSKNGRINYKHTTCTLCPMGCGVRVRCVENQPVSLSGIPNHPMSAGSLCAMGIAGHLLGYHPSRLLTPVKRIDEQSHSRFVPVSANHAMNDLAQSIASDSPGSVAVLDLQPDRTLSYVYRIFLARMKRGVYVTAPSCNELPAKLSDAVLRSGKNIYGFDVEKAHTLLSFGTPVLDGWGTQRQFREITEARMKGGRERLRIIQVEPAHSRTAQLSDEWVPVRPGTESIFALGIAHVILEENLCDVSILSEHSSDFDGVTGGSFKELAKRFSTGIVSEKTAIPQDKIRDIARELVHRKPTLVVFGGSPAGGPFSFPEQVIFMDLNLLLGSVGKRGGLLARRELPGPFESDELPDTFGGTHLEDVPDYSIGVLIMDGADSGDAIPWALIRRKLIPGKAVVVSLASHLAGISTHADYVLPSPGYMETIGDVPTPPGATSTSYSLTCRLKVSPPGSIQPVDFLKGIFSRTAGNGSSHVQSFTFNQLLHERVRRIYSRRRGYAFDAFKSTLTPISSLDPPSFRNILEQGGCWIDNEPQILPVTRYSFLGNNHSAWDPLSNMKERGNREDSIVVIPTGTRGVGTVAQQNPMMSKLYRESDARQPANAVSINPETGKKNGLREGMKATIKSEFGAAVVRMRLDPAVMPGVLEASVSPSSSCFDRIEAEDRTILDICKIENDSTWRATDATIQAT